MKRLALIDGDEVAFKACAVTATQINWGDGTEKEAPSRGHAVRAAREMLRAWQDKVEADSVIICLSCRNRELFRRRVSPAYKTDRTDKPEAFWAAVSMMEKDFECREEPGLEADDVMGILSKKTADVQPIIVSSDKDMRTIPDSWIFDPYHGTKKKITRYQADLWWMTQTLTGDPVDGYKGLPGCGPKRAAKVLDGCTGLADMWGAVLIEYASKDLHEGFAITQARLARILRPEDHIDGKFYLWSPSGRREEIPT